MTHGTYYAYLKRKCRCDACKASHARMQRGFRESKKARGLCQSCSQPSLLGLILCATHNRAHIDRQAQRRRAKSRQPRVRQLRLVTAPPKPEDPDVIERMLARRAAIVKWERATGKTWAA